MATVFEDVFGHRLHLDADHRQHILAEHPEVRPYLKRLGELFGSPEWVKRSRRDPQVQLYYRFYPDLLDGKYLLGVAKIGHRSAVLTCYVTDTIKHGEVLWPKS
ncbi:MAG: hypothetical protein HYY58_02795 [Candidatus Omnitrophica bacterium]|nr:hypothetical protein [Candidatus Omnitrophota bacterium]